MGKHPLTRAEVNQLLAVVALGAAVGFIWQTLSELADARRELRTARWENSDLKDRLDAARLGAEVDWEAIKSLRVKLDAVHQAIKR